MESWKWNEYLKKFTGEYGIKRHPASEKDETGHLGITYKFFKDLNIDSENKKFLDVGCESCNTEKDLRSGWAGIDIIQREDPDILVADAHSIPIKDNWYDIVFSSHMLEHTLSPLICLIEMFRVLKSDGDLVIGVPCDPGFYDKGHNYLLTLKGWKHLIEQAGFKVVKAEENNHCGCLHAKKV